MPDAHFARMPVAGEDRGSALPTGIWHPASGIGFQASGISQPCDI